MRQKPETLIEIVRSIGRISTELNASTDGSTENIKKFFGWDQSFDYQLFIKPFPILFCVLSGTLQIVVDFVYQITFEGLAPS
jgi:hypothetical protein